MMIKKIVDCIVLIKNFYQNDFCSKVEIIFYYYYNTYSYN